MDIAYDHVQEETLASDSNVGEIGNGEKGPTLNDEFKDAYKAISASPWGARFGAFMGTVKKQVNRPDKFAHDILRHFHGC
jgi:hypothetical protein